MFGKDCGHTAGMTSFVCPACDALLKQMQEQAKAKDTERFARLFVKGSV